MLLDTAGRAFDLAPLLGDGDLDGAFFEADGIELATQALAAGSLEERPIAGERVGPPIARPPAVVCVGRNYREHAAESGNVPPKEPMIFLKHPNTVVGPFDDVPIPRHGNRVDWELELAVVVGRRCRYLESPEQSLSHVAGYTIANDVSEREFQIELSGGQWSKGKCCEGFNPVGPWLVPTRDIPDPQQLRLRSFVNGEPRQDESTAQMVFSVAYLVWHLSQFLVLEPGDLLETGTPAGVALSGKFPYLQPGDRMTMEIEGLGRQEQLLVAAT